LGRVLFSAKGEPAKAEPSINWSEIESRLQEISAPASTSAKAAVAPVENSCVENPAAAEASFPVQTLANHPPLANDPFATGDQPVTTPADPLDLLSRLSAISSSRS